MLDDLLLLRLWAARDATRGELRSRVAADLRPLAGEGSRNPVGWRDLFAAAVGRLAEAGCLTVSGRAGARLVLNDNGRTRARRVFKILEEPVPGQTDKGRVKGWAWWRDRCALPLALGGDRAGDADELRVALLRHFCLPEWPPGMASGSLQKTVDLLLARRLKVSRPSPGAFRQAALQAWVALSPAAGRAEPQTAAPASVGTATGQGRLPDALPTFAEQTILAARRSPTGRFGDKVFVSHVWRALLAAGQAAPGEADEFKARLLRANTAGLLRLSRADLAGAHGSEDVRGSEVSYLGETFHFVRLD